MTKEGCLARSASDEGISLFLLRGRNEIPHFVRNDGGGGVIASVRETISSLPVRRLYIETASGHRVPRSDRKRLPRPLRGLAVTCEGCQKLLRLIERLTVTKCIRYVLRDHLPAFILSLIA